MRRLLKILLFTAAFIFSLYIFLPYREIGKFAMSAARSQLERMGMRVSYSDVSGVDGGFSVHNLRLTGMTDISFGSLTIKPEFAASILSLSPVCNISFSTGSVRLGQVMSFGDGGFLLTYSKPEILLENLRTNGDFSLNGYMTIDTANMKIGHADARLEVPELFAHNMDMLKNFLPLVNEGGKWYLRRR